MSDYSKMAESTAKNFKKPEDEEDEESMYDKAKAALKKAWGSSTPVENANSFVKKIKNRGMPEK